MKTAAPLATLRAPALALVLCLCLAPSIRASVPGSQARNLDTVGIGMVMAAGPVYETLHGLAPNQILCQSWFHYYPNVIGGAGLEFSSRNPSPMEAFTQIRYDVTSTWIPWRTPKQALELSAVASLTGTSSYLDTLRGADPIRDDGSDLGLSLRIGYGRRPDCGIGWWASIAPALEIRVWGTNDEINPVLQAEAGLAFSMLDHWHNARKLSRAWDIFLRVPLKYQPAEPRIRPDGTTRASSWTIGIQAGPSVLF